MNFYFDIQGIVADAVDGSHWVTVDDKGKIFICGICSQLKVMDLPLATSWSSGIILSHWFIVDDKCNSCGLPNHGLMAF